MAIQFEFAPQKSARNKDKHGIDFVAAQTMWSNRVDQVPAAVVNGEMRYANFGKIGNGYWTVIITYRGAVRRIISAYPSKPDQIAYYERSRKPSA